jgi:hypothetical protein
MRQRDHSAPKRSETGWGAETGAEAADYSEAGSRTASVHWACHAPHNDAEVLCPMSHLGSSSRERCGHSFILR